MDQNIKLWARMLNCGSQILKLIKTKLIYLLDYLQFTVLSPQSTQKL